MCKFLQIGLVLVYMHLVAFAALIALILAGVHISDKHAVLGATGWLLFCAVGAWIVPYLVLFRRSQTRKPILEEEEKMFSAFREVKASAQCNRPIRLLIEETMALNAYAIGYHTIVVSKGMLQRVTSSELKGVMAHELGHLVSGDTLICSAFVTSAMVPRLAKRLYRIVRGIFAIILGGIADAGLLVGTLLLIGLCWLLDRAHLVWPLLALMLFVLLFTIFEIFFVFLWRAVSRFTEYKQDEYAWRLGYGSDLRQALGKIVEEGPQKVNVYITLMTSSHPVIYNRIRRLERLEGLREYGKSTS